MRQAQRARDVLTEIPIPELIGIMKKAADLYLSAALPMGDGEQTPGRFRAPAIGQHRPAGTYVQGQHEEEPLRVVEHGPILDALTRGLDLEILTRGYGVESRGVTVSYQTQAPVLGLVLPSNSPGVHTLWLPVIPMQIGLVLKPGPQEPGRRTAWRPRSSKPVCRGRRFRSIPAAETSARKWCAGRNRSMIFGGTATVERYKGDPRVQVHGPGFSKILLGDDVVDQWEKYLDIMADSVFAQQRARMHQLFRHLGVASYERNRAGACRAAGPGRAEAARGSGSQSGGVHGVPARPRPSGASIEVDLDEAGVERHDRPLWSAAGGEGTLRLSAADVIHCDSPEATLANTEFMFPFVERRQVPARGDAEENRPDVGLQRDHPGLAIPADADRRTADRPTQHRGNSDDQARLAAAARRQYRRVPVSSAGISGSGSLTGFVAKIGQHRECVLTEHYAANNLPMSFAEPDGGQLEAMSSLTGQLRPVRAPRIKWRRRFSAALRRGIASFI